MIVKGGKVRVYPHGSPEQGATGTVLIISEARIAVVVEFDKMPPFALRGRRVQRDHGIVFVASRVMLNGESWGPWVELGGGGHYEIEIEVPKEPVQ
jgi:hypothetical protein